MDNFLGEIRLFAMSFAPRGWALCNGAIMNIQQNQALYAVLGTMYGGDGRTTFGLPDLRGRLPVGMGQKIAEKFYQQGQLGGLESVPLTTANVPVHTHTMSAAKVNGTVTRPTAGDILAQPIVVSTAATHAIYAPPGPLATMSSLALSSSGADAKHNNMQPFTVLNFCIATTGIFPPHG